MLVAIRHENMNSYKKEFLKKVKQRSSLGMDRILTDELTQADWLDSHELTMTNSELDDEPYTLEISSTIKGISNSRPILIDLSKRLINILDSIDDLLDKGYIFRSRPMKINVPSGKSLFTLGKRFEDHHGVIIFPDQELTNKLSKELNTVYGITENGIEFVENNFKTNEQIKQEKSAKLTTGILTANKFGLGLTGLILLLSVLSIFNSNKSSKDLKESLGNINDSTEKLETSLQRINDSFKSIESLVTQIDSTSKIKKENLSSANNQLLNSVNNLKMSVNSVSKELKVMKMNSSQLNREFEKIKTEG